MAGAAGPAGQQWHLTCCLPWGGGLPGHPTGQEKSLLCLQVSLPLTSSDSSLLEDLAGEPVFTAPFALDLSGL